MLHTITKRLETCIEINIDRSYTWIFTSRISRLPLELTLFLNKYFFLQMACELLSQSRKLYKREGSNKDEGGWKSGGSGAY